MRLSDIIEPSSIEDILSDDPLEDVLDEMSDGDFEVGFLGKLVKGIAKGVKAVGKVALPVVKMVPGIGNAVSAAETGVNLAVGVGKAAGIGQKKGGAAPAKGDKPGKKLVSTAATPAVISAAVKASKATAPRKPVVVKKEATKIQRPAVAASIQPSVVVKAAPLDISKIVGNFSASVSPQLNAIAGMLKQEQLQKQAQSEHNQRVKDASFKRHVVKQLAVKG